MAFNYKLNDQEIDQIIDNCLKAIDILLHTLDEEKLNGVHGKDLRDAINEEHYIDDMPDVSDTLLDDIRTFVR